MAKEPRADDSVAGKGTGALSTATVTGVVSAAAGTGATAGAEDGPGGFDATDGNAIGIWSQWNPKVSFGGETIIQKG